MDSMMPQNAPPQVTQQQMAQQEKQIHETHQQQENMETLIDIRIARYIRKHYPELHR